MGVTTMYLLLCLCSFCFVTSHMTDDTFFAALDLSLPALAGVRTAYRASDLTTAKSLLAAYYRQRSIPWLYNVQNISSSLIKPNYVNANIAHQGYITPLAPTYKFPSGAEINWTFNPTTNVEWQFALVRCPTWLLLADTWYYYQNRTLSQSLTAQIATFMHDCPVPRAQVPNTVHPTCWRTIEAGLRGMLWPDIFNRLLHSPDFIDALVINWLKSFLDHANFLYQFQPGYGNWVASSTGGLYYIGSFLPEFLNATKWRVYAASYLYTVEYVGNSISPANILSDGMEYELSSGYNGVVLADIQKVALLATATGRFSELPAGYVNSLQTQFLFTVYVMDPAGYMPSINDGGAPSVKAEATLALQNFPDNPIFQWAASGRTQGHPPAFTSLYLNVSKFIVMRTGWGFNDNYLFFDVAALGVEHYHQDKLNVIINVYGRNLVFDSCEGYNLPQRWYCQDSVGHNTVTVDDKSQRRSKTTVDYMGYGNSSTPPAQFTTSSASDYGVGYYMDNYEATRIATHKREILFIKNQLPCYVIVDTLTPFDTSSHNYKAHWHVLTTSFTYNTSSKITTSTDPGVPNLIIAPLMTSSLTVTNYLGYRNADNSTLYGWFMNGGVTNPDPALQSIHMLSGPGVQQFVTFLLPVDAGKTAIITSVSGTKPNYVVNFRLDTVTYRLVITLGTNGGISYSWG